MADAARLQPVPALHRHEPPSAALPVPLTNLLTGLILSRLLR